MWTTFGVCSKTCGGGIHIRTRTCNNPKPQYGGASCAGEATESSPCGLTPCAGKSITFVKY